MQTELGIDRARRHTTDADRSGFEGIFSISPDDKASEHFILAKGALENASGAEKDELQGIVNQLEDLMKARSAIMKSKVHLLEEYVDKVSQGDAGDQQDLESARNSRDSFRAAAHGIDGSKSVFAKQIMQIREGDLESLLNTINEYDQIANEKKSLYANYLELSGEASEALDKMRTELLKHLAGNIVVKEHKIRYQKEQFDRFVASSTMSNLKN